EKARRQSKLVPVLCMLVAMLGAGCVAGLLKFRYEYPLDGLVSLDYLLRPNFRHFSGKVLAF
ncbi:hypothetical protein, partial [Okeania sp. SIO2B9]|uniref:hypothetical protein n=1 Tax=Okeania sp. SIO2B9 TaxID=2607782 RepID=UPI002579F23F